MQVTTSILRSPHCPKWPHMGISRHFHYPGIYPDMPDCICRRRMLLLFLLKFKLSSMPIVLYCLSMVIQIRQCCQIWQRSMAKVVKFNNIVEFYFFPNWFRNSLTWRCWYLKLLSPTPQGWGETTTLSLHVIVLGNINLRSFHYL